MLCHISAFVGEEPGLWHRGEVYLWLRGTALGVQLFFVLSGIVIFTAHRHDIDKPSAAPAFYRKRFRRIYPLYWIFLLPTVLQHSIAQHHNASHQTDFWVIFSSVMLVHLFSIQTVMVVAWTLFDEVLFYVFFSVMLLNGKTGRVILLLWMGASLFSPFFKNVYWQVMFSPNHLLFGMGILVAWMLEKNWRVPAKTIFWIGAIFFVACIVIDGPFARGTAVHLAAGAAAAGILFGLATLERRDGWSVPACLYFLGDASYSIYLVHFMVISAVARFSYSHLHRWPVPIGVWMAVLFTCGTAAGIVAHLAIERPLLRVLRKPATSMTDAG